ncbi:hypothetical protein [Paraburkholderia terrae]|uniref:hypothetical protein n=1 Tax=Paraburkholderia terrae TaxID=311230 RepID=UPI0014701573|nr:hypothetical protein [Paraburkholderia terrae]
MTKSPDPGIPYSQSMMHVYDQEYIVNGVGVDADDQPAKPVKVNQSRPQQTDLPLH